MCPKANAHNIQQMECWKPCNELSSEKNGYNYKECQKLTISKVNKRGKKIIGKINK
jgi:hypothetical protein